MKLLSFNNLDMTTWQNENKRLGPLCWARDQVGFLWTTFLQESVLDTPELVG